MELLMAYLGCAVVATAIVTTLVCRRRSGLKKKTSFGILLASPLIANAVVFALFGSVMFKLAFWTPDFWRGNWAMGAAMPVVIIITVMCILPALGIVVFYHKRGRKDG